MENTNEIDLIDLTKSGIIRFYNFFTRRYKLLAVSLLVGAFMGIGIYLKDKSKYETTIIATCELIKSEYIISIINSLNDIKNEKGALAGLLNLNAGEGDKLLSISADTLESKYSLQIKLRFKKELALKNFTSKLLQYIDSNAYVQQEYQLEKQRCLAIIEKYDHEIMKLDNLQTKILSSDLNKSGGTHGNLLVMNDKVNNFFHKDKIELEGNRQNEIKRLKRLAPLQIVDAKSNVEIRAAKLFPSIFKMMGIVFGLALILALVLEMKRFVELAGNRNNP